MDAEKWQKIKEIFNQAVEIKPENRASFLDSVCQGDEEIRTEIEKLLTEDLKDETLFDPFVSVPTFTGKINQTIGKYRLLQEIGEGGMGSVYLAEREGLGNKVALKIVKKGMDTADLLRRFQTEQQILANLEHPNIARLLDNGTTDHGLPYYVMEYVEGETLLNYAKDCSTQERLEIFRKICSAVQYAHNRLVVHRDLKPSNILITKENEPKLLDFGIAKVLTPEKKDVKGTATQLGMMTPNYASPEQLRGETVTTASDIYSLGVILYELMTGMLPFNLKQYGLAEMMQVVSNTEPIRPSDAATNQEWEKEKKGKLASFAKNLSNSPSQLKGDLDNIILKALKKEPDRRYLSAEQFSEDIRRHLEGLPVKARPDTFGYRASKFVKRNKLGVAAASLILLSLIGGIIGTTYQAQIAQAERARAEKRFEDLRGLSNRLVFKYNEAISNLPGAASTRAIFVKDAVEYLDSLAVEQSDDLKLQLELANAYLKVGDLQRSIYGLPPAETLQTFQKSLSIAEPLSQKLPQNDEVKTVYASALKNVGDFQSRLGNLSISIENLQKSVKISEELLNQDSANEDFQMNLAESCLALANVLAKDSAQSNSANDIFQKALKLAEDLNHQPIATAPVWRLFAVANQSYANFLSVNQAAESVKFHNKSVESFKQVLDNKPNNIQAKKELAEELMWRGRVLKKLGNSAQALNDFKQAVEILEELLQNDKKNEELQQLLNQVSEK